MGRITYFEAKKYGNLSTDVFMICMDSLKVVEYSVGWEHMMLC